MRPGSCWCCSFRRRSPLRRPRPRRAMPRRRSRSSIRCSRRSRSTPIRCCRRSLAATYPLEVVEAARWSRANPALTGQQAVDAAGERDWDPSVKSLAAFPQVLAMMDQHLEWTARLGDVFIAQEPQVMETVQSLRQKAYEAGNLRSTEQVTVYEQGEAYAIEPARPE